MRSRSSAAVSSPVWRRDNGLGAVIGPAAEPTCPDEIPHPARVAQTGRLAHLGETTTATSSTTR